MKHQNKLTNLMATARRGVAFAALMIFAATAGATWMDSSRAEADPGQPPTQLVAPGSAGAPAASEPDVRRLDETSQAQAYKSDKEPLRKNGKTLTGKLNINTADEDQLRMLPGIGPAKAQRVVRYRSKHGKFKRVRDLRRVKGFGYKTVKKLAAHLTVEGKSTLRAE